MSNSGHVTFTMQIIMAIIPPLKCIELLISKQHPEPTRNPLAVPEYPPKQNFATSPEPKFDNVNC
jgi:hypothetical protein